MKKTCAFKQTISSDEIKTNVKTCQSEFFMYEPEMLEMSERRILLTMRYMTLI